MSDKYDYDFSKPLVVGRELGDEEKVTHVSVPSEELRKVIEAAAELEQFVGLPEGSRRQMALLKVGDLCHGSQSNGTVWYGRIIGFADWDGTGQDDSYVIRYLYHPESDAPRRPYRVEEFAMVHEGLGSYRIEELRLAE